MDDVDWTAFFRGYAEANRVQDANRVAAFYADGFLVAAPTGASAFKNDDAFHAWLHELFRFNEQVGMQSLDVADARSSVLDERYLLVAVDWIARFRKLGEKPVPFRISYIVSLVDSRTPKIVGYISHDDQAEVMRRHGLC